MHLCAKTDKIYALKISKNVGTKKKMLKLIKLINFKFFIYILSFS
jgi:hypothetical protein